MDKLKKVIRGLECCAQMAGEICRKCPYANECEEGEGLSHLATDALALLKAQEPGWISVKERLPDEDADVLVFNRLGIEVAAYTTNPTKRWYGMSGNTVYAQYWMPLPKPPKEET